MDIAAVSRTAAVPATTGVATASPETGAFAAALAGVTGTAGDVATPPVSGDLPVVVSTEAKGKDAAGTAKADKAATKADRKAQTPDMPIELAQKLPLDALKTALSDAQPVGEEAETTAAPAPEQIPGEAEAKPEEPVETADAAPLVLPMSLAQTPTPVKTDPAQATGPRKLSGKTAAREGGKTSEARGPEAHQDGKPAGRKQAVAGKLREGTELGGKLPEAADPVAIFAGKTVQQNAVVVPQIAMTVAALRTGGAAPLPAGNPAEIGAVRPSGKGARKPAAETLTVADLPAPAKAGEFEKDAAHDVEPVDRKPTASSRSDQADAAPAHAQQAQRAERADADPAPVVRQGGPVERPQSASSNAPAAAAPASNDQTAVTMRPDRLGHTMGVEIARKVTIGGDELLIRMDPAELGRINVRLSFDQHGSLRAVVAAENPSVLDTLRRESGEITRALADAGVRTDSQSFRFDRNHSGGGSGGEGGSPWQRYAHHNSASKHGVAADEDGSTPAYRPLGRSGRIDVMA